MPTKYNCESAKWMGQQASIKGRPFRVSPFYEEYRVQDGKKVDITNELTKAWFVGYDEEEKVKLSRRKNAQG